MKKILITGANSYIGTSFENYIKTNYPGLYEIYTIEMIDGSWCDKNFTGFDSVFHVAGIAHADTGKVSDTQKAYYYQINTQLAIDTAKKAKAEGVKQFIFMSSAMIYGDSAPIGRQKIITKDTIPQPSNFYGKSKLLAEKGILSLQDDGFHVVVLRSPMIYGKGCKGNYQTLVKLALLLPFFPYIKNERSMLYIMNLCEFVRIIVDNYEQGIYWPQNAEYINTSEMVKMIAEAHGKKIKLVKGFRGLFVIMGFFSSSVNKAFGNLSYDNDMNFHKDATDFIGLKESIKQTES